MLFNVAQERVVRAPVQEQACEGAKLSESGDAASLGILVE